MCKTTKLGRMVIYNKGNSPIMSHDPPTTWSHEFRRKLKTKYAVFCKAYGCRTWQSGDEGNSPIMLDDPLIT